MLVFNQEFHLYYLHIILLVYAATPVMRVFVAHCTKREMEYALVLWFLTGILYPTVRNMWPFTLITGIPTQWLLNMTYASIGYGLLGYYLKQYPISRKCALVLLLCGVGVVFGGTMWMSAQTGALYEGFLEGMSVGVCLMAAGIYGLFVQLAPRGSGPMTRVVTYLSGASFCVYLVHSFFLLLLPRIGIDANLCFSLISVPVAAVCNLALCCLVYELFKRVPIVNRWLL